MSATTGIIVVLLIFISAMTVRIISGPNHPKEDTTEEYFYKKYGIEIEFSDDKEVMEYEVIVDKKTGKRIIREKKQQNKTEAIRGYLLPDPSLSVQHSYCSC